MAPVEPKITEPRAVFFALANALESQLNQVHRLAAEGEWEQIAPLTPEFIATIDRFRATPIPPGLHPTELTMLHGIERLLQSAATVCAERQQDIQPLINAFNATARNTESP